MSFLIAIYLLIGSEVHGTVMGARDCRLNVIGTSLFLAITCGMNTVSLLWITYFFFCDIPVDIFCSSPSFSSSDLVVKLCTSWGG